MAATDDERRDRIERYTQGPRLLREALARVPAEAMKWRPAAGKWSAHEVACHCADSETYAAIRIRFLLAATNPTILGYDENAWATHLDYQNHPLDLALRTVDAVRANTVPLLHRIEGAQFERAGHHSDSGPYSVDRWLELYAEHLEIHSRQVDRNLAAWNARERQA